MNRDALVSKEMALCDIDSGYECLKGGGAARLVIADLS